MAARSTNSSAMRISLSLRTTLMIVVLSITGVAFVQYQITIRGAQVTDGGKYTCKAKNEAGSADIDLTLKVLVPPTIDKSNIIGNPLAIAGRSIYLECPVTGIPQPTVTWYKEGNPIDLSDERILLDQNNQTFGILHVEVVDQGRYYCVAENKGGKSEQEFNLEVLVTGIPQPTVTWYKEGNPIDLSDERILLDQNNQTFGILHVEVVDQGRYYCVAENKGGKSEQEFNLEVLVPPQMETTEVQKFTRREDDSLTLWCPVRHVPDSTAATEIFWYKDGRPIDSSGTQNVKLSSDGRRLQLMRTTLGDAGNYSCIALNRAGESSLDFDVEILYRTLDILQPSISEPESRRRQESEYRDRAETVYKLHHEAWQRAEQERQRYIDRANDEYEARLEAWRKAKEKLDRAGLPVQQQLTTSIEQSHERKPESDQIRPPMNHRETATLAGSSIDTNVTDDVKIDIESNAALDPGIRHLHKLRRPHHKYHAHRQRGGHHRHRVGGGDTNAGYEQRTNVDHRDKQQQDRWGGKLLLYQKEWQPWDPDYSDGEWSSWYSYTAPKVDGSRNDAHPHVAVGRPITLWCITSGHPFPTIRWLKDGKVETGNTDNAVRILENGQALEIINARPEHGGIWTCEAENDAGKTELEFNVDVWMIKAKRTFQMNR
ncbi:Hemicentin-1 [Toxocara canis]|uniref:Hemicentin-1 n=1 Tax=Toxocara canis TaxID=6265 RepID=A0A0B2UIV5_TOXCA|nr:Hemicentin-1 [Toxocara canis]